MITAREKSKRKKRVKTGKARHAGTGKFVSKDFAKANSEIVVEETKPVEEKPAQENT